MRKVVLLSLVSAVLILAGCAGSIRYMQPVADPNVSYAPGENQATVVVMRASGMAYKIQSSVFDVVGDENKLVGILPAKKKVAYVTTPGEHLFMVIGETADFMKADLVAGKTYYAVVVPRMGAWKARFSLMAEHKEDIDTPKVQGWISSCGWVENTPASHEWATKNMPSVKAKQASAYKVWSAKADEDKPFLRPEDGK